MLAIQKEALKDILNFVHESRFGMGITKDLLKMEFKQVKHISQIQMMIQSLGIQSYCQRVIGVSNHLLSIA